ncbi:hypothetical protein Acr_06g0004230 [Actinidia rufa]|uniref:Uncharacterized protein n=1 Tax=Actinidia rufa TaxID=165716 RepID=A0A7J0EPY0_9ERIC|nr:hypothetical protein Acr_06g0004230 [Actinidia rufa]
MGNLTLLGRGPPSCYRWKASSVELYVGARRGTPEHEHWATFGGNPEGCQETEGDLHNGVSSDSSVPKWRHQKHDDGLSTTLQRTAKATSKQVPSRLLPEGEDNRDITIKRLQAQLAEMAQIMIDNSLMKPLQIEGVEPSRARSMGLKDPTRRAKKDKQHESHVDLDSQNDSKSMKARRRDVFTSSSAIPFGVEIACPVRGNELFATKVKGPYDRRKMVIGDQIAAIRSGEPHSLSKEKPPSFSVYTGAEERQRDCGCTEYEGSGGDLRLAIAGKQARQTFTLELGKELPNTSTVWAKAIVAAKLPLSSKLGMNNYAGVWTRGNVW